MAFGRFDTPKELILLTPDQVLEYSAAAESHYRPDLDYHNWSKHALAVVSGTEVIADKLENCGIRIARGAIAIAAAWHDAGYHENHREKGFATKEEYSAFLLDQYLRDKPVSDWERAVMLHAIIATWAEYDQPRQPYDLILHRADIANIGGPEHEFIENNVALWHEGTLMTGKKLSWEDHVAGTSKFVTFTAKEHDRESLLNFIDPKDTTLDVNDTPFSDTALRNLKALQEFER